MLALITTIALGFILSFLLRKKFGLPVLGLAAGSILSRDWSAHLEKIVAPYVGGYEIYLPLALIVLPSLLILLFAKAKVKKLPQKLINSGIYAVTLGVLTAGALPLADISIQATTFTSQYGTLIIGLTLTLATLQVAFGRAKRKPVEEPQTGHSSHK